MSADVWSVIGGPVLILGIMVGAFLGSLAASLLIAALIRVGQGGDKADRVPTPTRPPS